MHKKYDVLGIVGEGAYGIVYKCRDKNTNDIVAIKKFKDTGEDELIKKTMKRELRVLQQLSHENIISFLDAFKHKGNLFIVFEFVDRNILELIEQFPSGLSQPLIKRLIYQLCKAVVYLHQNNIIHRDIKPENLLVTNDYKLKLCDFGFARKYTGTNDINNNNLTDYVATRWYRAPEILISNGQYGPEVDYWAIGCLMGELIDGNPLFPGENECDQIHCIQKVLGNLPQEMINIFYKNPIYCGAKLLDVKKPETLEKRYFGKMSKVGISFMKSLLELNPADRLNGSNVLSHPYFKGMGPKENVRVKTNEDENKGTTNLNIINFNSIKNTIRNNFNCTTNNIFKTHKIIIKNDKGEAINNNNSNNCLNNNHSNSINDENLMNNSPSSNTKVKKISIKEKIPLIKKNMCSTMYGGHFFNKKKEENSLLGFDTQKSNPYIKKNSVTQKDLNNSSLEGFEEDLLKTKTFYQIKNNNDLYNFKIKTNFNKIQNQNACSLTKKPKKENYNTIEEEDEYQSKFDYKPINIKKNKKKPMNHNSSVGDLLKEKDREKIKALNNIYSIASKKNNSLSKNYNNYGNEYNKLSNHHNRDKTNPSNNSFFNYNSSFYLPNLCKVNGPNSKNEYYKSLKKFQMMVGK